MRVWAKVIKTDITTFSLINIAHAVFWVSADGR